LEFGAAFTEAALDTPADARPAATFWLEGGVTPAGAGFVWGQGRISYRGEDHPFRLSGLSITGVSAGSICATGSLMHLRRLSDFNGHYATSAAPGCASPATVAGGDSATYLENQHGVLMKLLATDAGLRFNLLVDRVRVRLRGRK